MAANLPLGTHFSDGVRSGPIYTSQLPATLVPNINGVITSSDYSTYGPGVLLSPQNSYNILTSPPNTVGGFDSTDNIVADTAVAGAGYLTLRGDNYVSYYTTGPNGLPLIQLDWPRVITVTISEQDAQADTRVTIFGYDYYGFPMQHTYVVEAQQTYPEVTQGVDDTDGTISLPCKAFYQVTGVYIDAALPGDSTISLGAADIFGLPYLVTNKGAITSIQWGTQTGGVTNPIIPTGELTTRVIGGPLTTVGIFVPASGASTAISGDVRGLYAPSTPSAVQTIDGNNVAYTNLIFTAYIFGMDTLINQQAEKQQQVLSQTGSRQGPANFPLRPADAYGLPQFYTGVSS